MATIEKTPENMRRYLELNAIDIVMTSGLALGDAFAAHLEVIDLEAGIDLLPADEKPSLMDLFSALVPDDELGPVHQAQSALLIARLLRSITPEVVEEAASYFESLAASNLAEAAVAA